MPKDITHSLNVGSCLNDALEAALKQEKESPRFFTHTISLIEDAIRQLGKDKKAYLESEEDDSFVDE